MVYGENVWKWPLDANSYGDFEYFFWVPWILPHVGALFGAATYVVFISLHHSKRGEIAKQDHD